MLLFYVIFCDVIEIIIIISMFDIDSVVSVFLLFGE